MVKADFTCLILIASLAITITQALPKGCQNDQADQSMKEQPPIPRRFMMRPFDSTPCEESFFYHGECQ
ncbi:3226_t:CDS:1, partial [Racocetra fulgida]